MRGQLEASIGRYGDGRTTPAMRLDLSRRSGAVLTEGSLVLERTVDDEKGRGPRTRINPNGTLREALTYDEHDGFRNGSASLGHERPLLGGKLRANLAVKRERERAATALDTSFPAPGLENVLERETQDEGELGATWDRALGARLSLELTGLERRTRDRATEHSDDGTGTQDVGERSTGGERIGRALLRWQAGKTLALEGGGEGAFNFLDSHASLRDRRHRRRVARRQRSRRRTPRRRVRDRDMAGHAAAQHRGRRARRNVEARAIRRFQPHQAARLRQTASVRDLGRRPRHAVAAPGRAAGGPARFRRFRQFDVAHLRAPSPLATATSSPTAAGSRALAWERRFWSEGAIVLTARHEWISHTVDRVGVFGPGFAFDARGNIGPGRKTRLEASLSLPLDRFGIAGGLLKAEGGYRWTSVIDPTTGERRGISGEEPMDGEASFHAGPARPGLSLGRRCGHRQA